MSSVRLLSIVKSTPDPLFERVMGIDDIEVTTLVRIGHGLRRILSLQRWRQVSSEGRSATYQSVAAALEAVKPNVVHLQMQLGTSVARRIARLCSRRSSTSLVVELGRHINSYANWRLRRPLSLQYILDRTDVILAPTATALVAARRIGFCGVGVIADQAKITMDMPIAGEARRRLEIADSAALVVGWWGAERGPSAVIDFMEVVVASSEAIAFIIMAPSAHLRDLMDRAEALDVSSRILFLDTRDRSGADGQITDLEGQQVLLAASDVVVVAPAYRARDRHRTLRALELAQRRGVPFIQQTASSVQRMIGPGGWVVPANNPSVLARMFTVLSRTPHLLSDASAAGVDHATALRGSVASDADLGRVIVELAKHAGGPFSTTDATASRNSRSLMTIRAPGQA